METEFYAAPEQALAAGWHGRGGAAPPLHERVLFHVLLTSYEIVCKHVADLARLVRGGLKFEFLYCCFALPA